MRVLQYTALEKSFPLKAPNGRMPLYMSADGKSNISQVFLKAYLHPFRKYWEKKSTLWVVAEAIRKKQNLAQEIQY